MQVCTVSTTLSIAVNLPLVVMLGGLSRENPLQFQCSFLNSSSQFFLASCSAYFKIGNSSGFSRHTYRLCPKDLKLVRHSNWLKTGGVGGLVGESVVLLVWQGKKQLQNMMLHLERRGENNSISLPCRALG